MLCGYAPFAGENTRKLFSAIKQGKFGMEDGPWEDVSEVRGMHLLFRLATPSGSLEKPMNQCIAASLQLL